MKKLLIWICILMPSTADCTENGIHFVENAASWQAIVDQSKTENKPIFVDVYTEWCGPCKWMDQNVFNQAEVGEFMNREFINVKVDAEKGWGVGFAKQYHVRAYPTYLFFDTNAEVVMTAMGSKPSDRFLNESRNALERFRSDVTASSNATLSLQEFIAADQLSSDKVWKLLSGLDKSDPQLPYYLDLFLDQLSPDSLLLPSTAVIIHGMLSAPIIPSSKALNTLMTIVREHPAYTATMMSAWITLTELFQSTSNIAGAESNDALLADVLSLQDTLYQDQEMADLFKSYYTTRYFAKKGHYPEFIYQFEAFLNDHFLQADWERVSEVDRAHFLQSLELTHGTVDPREIGKDKYELAGRIHYSLFRLSFTHLSELTSAFREQFPEEFEKYDKKQMARAMEAVNEQYEKNAVYINPGLVNINQRYIDRYKGML